MKRAFQLIAASTIFVSGALLLAQPRPFGKAVTEVILTWSSSQTGMVFNVRSIRTNQLAAPSLSWPIVAVTTGHSVRLPIDRTASCVWFTVTASNALGESPFATR